MTEFNVASDATAAAVYLSGAKLRSTENIYFDSIAVLCGENMLIAH